MTRSHSEAHQIDRIGWLRAAVLGANDGIVSTASLIVGVALGGAGKESILLFGIAGLVAGAMSMAAGEYVSVSSQADTEAADKERESVELAENPEAERKELIAIYQARGLDPLLAGEVADQLMAQDALATHLRDELGISAHLSARPIQAALVSASSFAAGAVMPLMTAYLFNVTMLATVVAMASLCFLALLGWVGAMLGGAPPLRSIARVTFWGGVAMSVTAAIGKLVGTSLA